MLLLSGMPGETKMVKIKLYLEGKQVAERNWPQVPRVNESIMLYGKLRGTYKILAPIIWAGDDHNPQALIDIEAV